MSLLPGTVDADSGMAKAIYDHVNQLLTPPLQEAVDKATGEAKDKAQEALDKAQAGWRKLSFSIATGVISHLLSNLEIRGVQTSGTVNAPVNGQSGPTPPGPHQHQVSLTAAQAGLTFTQSNSGTGLVS
jgi:hypothetical protein